VEDELLELEDDEVLDELLEEDELLLVELLELDEEVSPSLPPQALRRNAHSKAADIENLFICTPKIQRQKRLVYTQTRINPSIWDFIP